LDSIIKVEAYSKYFGQNLALENIDLSIKKGEVVSIIGPSGSGKSTLLRSLIGLEQGSSGIIKINNMEIFDNQKEIKKTKLREIHREMAMVFQNFNLFPHLNVRDNITMGLKIVDGVAKVEANKRADELLDKVGLGHKGDSYIKELSGGQKQRVAIARALARNPEIILFDEPTSALDPELVNGVLEVIASLKGTNITMVIVSHEMNFVKNISDRVVFMEQGQVLKTGKVDEIFDKNYFPRIENYLNNF
jgi:ABC-type polar amino acid transport system ATPase subunit